MKRLFLVFLVLLLLISCKERQYIIDTSEYEDIKVSILSDNKDFGKEILIQGGGEDFSIDVKGMNPWRVDFCNVDGGEPELAIGVYKKSPKDSKVTKRVFFYNLDFENKRLLPKLRISRLNNPLVDFSVYDIDRDGKDEILSVERTINGRYEIGGYCWTNFSFNKNYRSNEIEEEVQFRNKEATIKVKDELKNLYLEGGKIKWK